MNQNSNQLSVAINLLDAEVISKFSGNREERFGVETAWQTVQRFVQFANNLVNENGELKKKVAELEKAKEPANNGEKAANENS
jgi:hypothetical protein